VKVLHVSPTAFGPGSIVGGGERYALELARAMAGRADVALLTFGADRGSSRQGGLSVECLRAGWTARWNPLAANPLRARFAALVRWADVVHAHQVATFTTAAAMTLGRALGRRTFVTDLGGGHRYAPTNYLPILRRIDGMLLLSEYSRRLWETMPRARRPARLEVVYGGIDPLRFGPGTAPKQAGGVLFVGRVLPHKGIDYLIEAIQPPFGLTVAGRHSLDSYSSRLRALAAGRPVRFLTDVTDQQLVDLYRRAMVTVLPSVHVTSDGVRSEVPELLGLVVLESLACGTPAIVTGVASLPELVEDGVTGFIVPPNDPGAIRDRLEYLQAHPDEVARMGQRGRARVLERFTWDAVARSCLAAYAASGQRVGKGTR
jgi:glycosyltransferase involved in cell wall biosynthesis